MLEVGVFEDGWIFEAVAEEAVDGYVGGPDERDGQSYRPVLEVAGEEKSEGEREGVGEVVGGGAEAGVGEVAEHEEVGRKEEDGEEEPACVEVLVGKESEDQKNGFFDAEEGGGVGQHEVLC